MNRILVTGATGFIGRHTITPLIEKGYEVHAVTSRKAKMKLPGAQIHHTNLLNTKDTYQLLSEIRPTHMLHFAWYTKPKEYWFSPKNFHWLEASIALMRFFGEFGGKRLVMAGTCAEYDWNYCYCSESVTPCRPVTPYGVCKNALQQTFRAFCEKENISGAWGRIFYLYGPGENSERLVTSVIKTLLKGEKVRCTHGEQIRDFLHVYDVASAFVALVESSFEGPVNIASGQPVTLRDVIKLIAYHLDASKNLQFGALEVPENEPPLLVGDCRKIQNNINWHPSYNLTDGIAHTILYLKNRK
jgi:nucleoside-diphosphate-sugar epimerase